MQLRCVALFDWSRSIDKFDLLKIGMDWFRPKSDLGSIFATRKPMTKPRPLSEKKLKEFIANRDAFSSVEFCPNGVDDFTCYFCLSESENGAQSLTICLPAELLKPDEVQGLVSNLAPLGDLGYGIVFTQNDQKNPAFRASGITHGYPATKEEEEVADRDSIWFRERISMGGNPPKMRHKAGFLRDVYELNVLNSNHARAIVDGQDLVSWIAESKVRGTLVRVSDSNILWTVPSAYSHHIRDSMSKNGLLLS
jgi:hypothetical protein